MIYIITGPINTGKTTWLINDYPKHSNSDGFACRKVFSNNIHIGYELIHLYNNESCQFIRKIDYIPEKWSEAFRLGNHYSFNKEGFDFAAKITNDAINKKVSRFYLDELGHLELKNQGFADILKKLLEEKIDLVLIIRESLIDKVVEHYEITEYKIITPSK